MTLYALQPDPVTGSLDDDVVVSESKYGWEFLEQAVTLWRLVDTARAEQIEAIMNRVALVAGDGELRIDADDLRELVRLLSDVDDALIAAGIVDRHWRVPADQLEALAKRVPAMDLKTERPLATKTSALGEVMSNAIFLRNFLENAVKAGCIVVLG
jgi:ATP phosphoribosyltransferase